MSSSTSIQQCDYLHSHTLAHVFMSERAELAHLNEQIRSLDSHLSQLNTLRRVLHDRSCQLHNRLAQIYTLPMEVLSHIFQQFVDLGPYIKPGFRDYRERLGGALVLSSVSSHFRCVAFATPKLWRSIPLYITDDKEIGNTTSLLQHCLALASSVNISVSSRLSAEQARSAVDIILTSDVTRKVKNFELYESLHTSVWVEKLGGSSFSMLEALQMTECGHEPAYYDFGSLKTLTHLNISDSYLFRPVVVPPSLQYLNIGYPTLQVFLSLLRQSLNLVECEVHFDSDPFDYLADDAQFTLTSSHLKRLAFSILDVAQMSLLAENIQLPSIQTLQLECYERGKFIGAIPLCRSVSATLTTLVVHVYSDTLDFDHLYQVCRLPFPQVRRLEFWSSHLEPFLEAIHALALLDGEYSNPENHQISALKSIFLSCRGYVRPRSFLDSLKRWRVGKAFHFHFQLDRHGLSYHTWPPKLREELKSIVGERRIEVMWEDWRLV